MLFVARALTNDDLTRAVAVGRRGRRTRGQARRNLEIRRRRPGQWPSTNAAFREARQREAGNGRPYVQLALGPRQEFPLRLISPSHETRGNSRNEKVYICLRRHRWSPAGKKLGKIKTFYPQKLNLRIDPVNPGHNFGANTDLLKNTAVLGVPQD